MKKKVILVTKTLPLLFNYKTGTYYKRGDIIEEYSDEMVKTVQNNPHALAFIEKDFPDLDDKIKDKVKKVESNVVNKVKKVESNVVNKVKKVEKKVEKPKAKKSKTKKVTNTTVKNAKTSVTINNTSGSATTK